MGFRFRGRIVAEEPCHDRESSAFGHGLNFVQRLGAERHEKSGLRLERQADALGLSVAEQPIEGQRASTEAAVCGRRLVPVQKCDDGHTPSSERWRKPVTCVVMRRVMGADVINQKTWRLAAIEAQAEMGLQPWANCEELFAHHLNGFSRRRCAEHAPSAVDERFVRRRTKDFARVTRRRLDRRFELQAPLPVEEIALHEHAEALQQLRGDHDA